MARKGTVKERLAKDKLLELLKNKPEVMEGKWKLKEIYEWLKQEHPEITEVLDQRQVSGVWTMLKNPLFKNLLPQIKKQPEVPPKVQPQVKDKPEEKPKTEATEEKREEGGGSGQGGQDTGGGKPRSSETRSQKTSGGEGGENAGGYGPGPHPPSSGEDVHRIIERELLVEATPIIRKVVLNPKVLLWYDYARSELGFDGDLGDFIYDAVEDFWERRGYKIEIVKRKEV
jgi:hypothetical protein